MAFRYRPVLVVSGLHYFGNVSSNIMIVYPQTKFNFRFLPCIVYRLQRQQLIDFCTLGQQKQVQKKL